MMMYDLCCVCDAVVLCGVSYYNVACCVAVGYGATCCRALRRGVMYCVAALRGALWVAMRDVVDTWRVV